ncbi:uncharacterized protein LOC115456290 isoform X1 [Manduca sexta]|nr:uncharacterized protein LOC115456290 isoform X1 [Manduca sexta]
MLTCINGSWKLPVGYFLVEGVTAEQKASLVKSCLDVVTECGVDIFSVTFDGCAANFSMAKILGCNIETNFINPVFFHKDKELVIFPDPSHMLKLIRNTLGDKLILTNGNGDSICWSYIELLVELQEKEGFHLANKIRGSHVNYKKQIMKVRLAAQLLSESVANALEFCSKELSLEQFGNCDATADFIRKFNILFDILNTRNLKAYGYKKPLMTKNYDNIKKFLDEMFDYIKSIKIGNTNILLSKRKTGFIGFLLNIKAILFLYDKLIKTNRIEFLSSYKLSQDHLEIFFSAIRAKGGFNNNPTAAQFKSAYKRMLIHGELKHLTTGNCIPLTDIHILTYNEPELAINKTTGRSKLTSEDFDNIQKNVDTENVVLPPDHDYLADPTRLTEFAEKVIVYIAGFIIKSLENQIKCEQCLESLYNTEKIVNSLQFKKDKGGLRYPSRDLIYLCTVAEEVYIKNKNIYMKDVMHNLLQECIKKCYGKRLFAEVPHDFPSSFINHYPMLIKSVCKKYLNVRLHYSTKSYVDKKDSIRNLYTKLILFKGQ